MRFNMSVVGHSTTRLSAASSAGAAAIKRAFASASSSPSSCWEAGQGTRATVVTPFALRFCGDFPPRLQGCTGHTPGVWFARAGAAPDLISFVMLFVFLLRPSRGLVSVAGLGKVFLGLLIGPPGGGGLRVHIPSQEGIHSSDRPELMMHWPQCIIRPLKSGGFEVFKLLCRHLLLSVLRPASRALVYLTDQTLQAARIRVYIFRKQSACQPL